MNSYGYVLNDPINLIDPNGRYGLVVGIGVVIAIALYGDDIYQFINSGNEGADVAAARIAAAEEMQAANRAYLNQEPGAAARCNAAAAALSRADRNLLGSAINVGRNAPSGTSFTGPLDNPFNPAEAPGIILDEALRPDPNR